MIVYNSDYVLAEALKSVLPFGPLVVTEGPCGYWADTGALTSNDNTNDILEAHKGYGYGIAGIVHGQFSEKDEMVNASAHLIPEDTTHVFVVDSDEVWREGDMRHVLSLISEWDLDSMGFTADSFFGGFDRILTGFERNFEVIRVQRWHPGAFWSTHRPPTVVNAFGQPYAQCRHMGHTETLRRGISMPHYSYVFPKQVLDKHIYYSSYSPGITIDDYVRRAYLPWVMGNDEKKEYVELEFSGIHNFVPSYRGPCFSEKFDGVHPSEIALSMQTLRFRFERELEWLKSQSIRESITR
jgi:hypothetical protein